MCAYNIIYIQYNIAYNIAHPIQYRHTVTTLPTYVRSPRAHVQPLYTKNYKGHSNKCSIMEIVI